MIALTMRVKTVLTLIYLNALAGICQVVYTSYDSGAKLNWHEAKSFCEERGLVLPVLDNLVVSLIISKYPQLAQEPFWGAGRCSWKNYSGYELDFTTSKYLINNGRYASGLTLECYGLPDSAPGAKPCTITTNYYLGYFLPACFPLGGCPSESLDYGGVCVGTSGLFGLSSLYEICPYQSTSSVEILERINKGLHLPLLSGQNATKYWIRLGTYSCTNNEYPSGCDFSEKGDCISLFYDPPNKQYLMNATDCRKALAKYIICYSVPTTAVIHTAPTSTPRRQVEQTSSSVETSKSSIKTTLSSTTIAEPKTETTTTIGSTSTQSPAVNESPRIHISVSHHPQATLQPSNTQNDVKSLIIAAAALGLFVLALIIVIAIFLHVRSSIEQMGSRLDEMSTRPQNSNPVLHRPENPDHSYHYLEVRTLPKPDEPLYLDLSPV